MSRRLLLLVVAAAAAFTTAVVLPARPASAHPLGNFTVNHLDQLTLRADGVTVDDLLDVAEIPTAQAQADVDTNHDDDASTAERDAYAQARCAQVARAQTLSIDGVTQAPVLDQARFEYTPGQAGLPASRLACSLRAEATLVAGSVVGFRDDFAADHIGWREVVAAGDGVDLRASDVPSASVTDGLRTYPSDQLSAPPKVTEATVTVGAVSSPTAPAGRDGRDAVDQLGPVAHDAAAGPLARVQSLFEDLVGRRDLTWPVGLLAVGLAILLGASHALLPGHGKTIMAAYIAGTEGTTRDAVLVGATVTGTHTSGVLLLGLALSLSTALAGEVVISWLGIVSGLFVVGLGVALLLGTVRRHGRARWSLESHHHGPLGHHHAHDDDGHPHDDHPHDDHPHDHHHHDDGHGQHHGVAPGGQAVGSGSSAVVLDAAVVHGSETAPGPRTLSRLGLVGMGAAGGLVPSPSALIILLSAIALGRTAFGVLLVLAYGIGLAATLTGAGVLLVHVRDRWVNRFAQGASRLGDRWRRVMPYATATLIIVVGTGLVLRSFVTATGAIGR